MQFPTLLPERLSPLPEAPFDNPWSADVLKAHNELVTAFNSARNALNLDESDPIRLRYHLSRASGFMVDIVGTLGLREVDPLPSHYINSLAAAVGTLVFRLRVTLDNARTRCVLFCALIQGY
jgi:hypothetical protein